MHRESPTDSHSVSGEQSLVRRRPTGWWQPTAATWTARRVSTTGLCLMDPSLERRTGNVREVELPQLCDSFDQATMSHFVLWHPGKESDPRVPFALTRTRPLSGPCTHTPRLNPRSVASSTRAHASSNNSRSKMVRQSSSPSGRPPGKPHEAHRSELTRTTSPSDVKLIADDP